MHHIRIQIHAVSEIQSSCVSLISGQRNATTVMAMIVSPWRRTHPVPTPIVEDCFRVKYSEFHWCRCNRRVSYVSWLLFIITILGSPFTIPKSCWNPKSMNKLTVNRPVKGYLQLPNDHCLKSLIHPFFSLCFEITPVHKSLLGFR